MNLRRPPNADCQPTQLVYTSRADADITSTYHTNGIKVPAYEAQGVQIRMGLQNRLHHLGAQFWIPYPLELTQRDERGQRGLEHP